MKTTREYRMLRRGEAVAGTRRSILEAVVALGYDELDLDPTLERIAAKAGVSVQTVLRHFGTRAALLDEAVAAAQAEVVAERISAAGGTDGALTALLAHYDRLGRFALGVLAREQIDPRAARIAEGGKRLHREWVETAFAEGLRGRAGGERDALVDLLVVATDVYAWKLLHLDRGLAAEVVLDRMRTLTGAVLASS